MSRGHRPLLLAVTPMQEEARALAQGFRPVRPGHALVELAQGEAGGTGVLSAVTGIGKVASAAAVQYTLDRHPVGWIVVVGVAGAVGADVRPGSIVITSRAVQWDVDARPLVDRPGLVPGAPEFALADPTLVNLARRACEALSTEEIRVGTALSGDAIVSTAALRDSVSARYPDAVCFDMETAAVGMVAVGNRVPWVGVRVISDSADEDLDITGVLHFAANQAGETLAGVVRGIGSLLSSG